MLFIFRPKHSFSLHIFIRPFRKKNTKKKLEEPAYFLCISLFFKLMYSIVFVVLFHFLLQFNYFDSQINHLIFKQDPITNASSIFRKNDISICFVHESQKWAIFGLTCKDKRSCDLVTVGPIFIFFFLKMRKTRRKKVSQRRGAIHMRSRAIGKIVEGGRA